MFWFHYFTYSWLIFQAALVEETVFSPLHIFVSFVKNKVSVCRCVDLSLGFLFCSIDLYFWLCANMILSWWLWLYSIVWSWEDWFLQQFHSSFSRFLWLFGVFLSLYKLWKIPISLENTIGSLICIESMLERVWRKGNPLTLLVGMQADKTTMENRMEISLKTKNKIIIQHSNPILSIYSEETRTEKRHIYPSDHCSTIYNSGDMEAT